MNQLRILFMTSRPVSWVNTAFPFAAGYLMLGGGFDARLIIGTLFFLMPYNLLLYGVNDVYDYESDIRNPRKGGVEGAVTPKKYHRFILLASVLSCAPFLIYLLLSGTLASGLTLGVVMFFVLAYSLRGLRFKEVPILDSITSSMHFVGPLIYAYSLLGVTTGEAWMIAAAFFSWGMASHAFGAVQDIIPDREANISSIATVFGARNTVRFSTFAYLLATLLVSLIGTLPAIIVAVSGLLYALNTGRFLGVTDATSPSTRAGWRRFMWLNYVVGAVVTIACIYVYVT